MPTVTINIQSAALRLNMPIMGVLSVVFAASRRFGRR
jgi:hypothetical protein